MKLEDQVKAYYPSAWLEVDGPDFWIWATIHPEEPQVIIGDSVDSEDDAWADAMNFIKQQEE